MRKRRKAAPGGRVLATGFGVSATLGIVAAMAAQSPPSQSPTSAQGAAVTSSTPATIVVTKVVPRTIEVDLSGLFPNQAPAGRVDDVGGTEGGAPASDPGGGSAVSNGGPAADPNAGSQASPGPSGGAPSSSGNAPAATNPAPQATAPAPAPAPAPATRAPAAPTCSGSKCP